MAPQNDSTREFFRSLFSPACAALKGGSTVNAIPLRNTRRHTKISFGITLGDPRVAEVHAGISSLQPQVPIEAYVASSRLFKSAHLGEKSLRTWIGRSRRRCPETIPSLASLLMGLSDH